MDTALHDEHVRELDRELHRNAMRDLYAAPEPDAYARRELGEAFEIALELDDALEERQRREKFVADGHPHLEQAKKDGLAECDARIERLRARLSQGTPSAPSAANKLDLTVLASRQQLIDAFGSFTGMDGSWFDNLKDAPKLRAARKAAGQGGKNFAEPLFCPYEVMCWLADPKRRKGRKLSEQKAWSLLEKHFPKIYTRVSVGDPRLD